MLDCGDACFVQFMYAFVSFVVLVICGADALLITDKQDPKCFSRTQEDFTCFFMTADNRTYDLLYKIDKYVLQSKYIVLYTDTFIYCRSPCYCL